MLPNLGVGTYEMAQSHGDVLSTSTGISVYFTWEQASLLHGGWEQAVYSDNAPVNNLWHRKSLNFRKLGCCGAGRTACYTLPVSFSRLFL